MENKKWTIYKHTSPSGKSYIGLTSKDPQIRWQNGTGYAPETQIRQAIYKYGWNAFSHTILETNIETVEKAKEREQYWIEYFDSFRNGYNMTEGGDTLDPSAYKKKPVLCYETNEIYDSSVDAAAELGTSYSNIGRACRTGIKCLGKHFIYLEDYYEGWTPRPDGRSISSKTKAVECKETGEIFDSIKEASNKMNITSSLISRCCNGVIKSTHGYHFCFIKEREEI